MLRDLCKTPSFAQFLCQAQILILKILNVFLWLKSSPSLNLNKIEHFSKVSLRLRHVRNTFLIVLSGLIVTLTFSCDTGDRYAGIYQSTEHPENYIELKENGVGVWRVIDDEASFRWDVRDSVSVWRAIDDEASFTWDVRDSELRLHTRAGGVVIGKIQNDTLQISLPTQGIKYFKRTR